MNLLALSLLASPAQADPCGMVSAMVADAQIERVGEQRTYVFYKDGVESIAIRPGFTGRTDDFGMLVPLPTVPAIRKLNDDVFAHLTAAIDPPEVVVRRWQGAARPNTRTAPSPKVVLEPGLHLNVREGEQGKVTVHREEAVGMYEVAVLEAGSPGALEGWMTDNGYKFPRGMEGAIAEYVAEDWVFVAVKAKVQRKSTPRPGMRSVDTSMPDGSEFTGHVQAMGFRFEVPAPVVPMKLSTFNGNDTHNVVYILTDEPVRFEGIATKNVVRQVPGTQLAANFTEPLPIRFEGVQPNQQWNSSRNPRPYNQIAEQLFASDLEAARRGTLALPFEEHDKDMPRISAALHLSGMDDLEAQAVDRQRVVDTDGALADLSTMTLTVVDGDFPREFLRHNNLALAGFSMPATLNSRDVYDARAGRDGTADSGEEEDTGLP